MKNNKMRSNKCKCPFCDEKLEFPFCKACDKEFLRCAKCGALIEKHIATCSKCGNKI